MSLEIKLNREKDGVGDVDGVISLSDYRETGVIDSALGDVHASRLARACKLLYRRVESGLPVHKLMELPLCFSIQNDESLETTLRFQAQIADGRVSLNLDEMSDIDGENRPNLRSKVQAYSSPDNLRESLQGSQSVYPAIEFSYIYDSDIKMYYLTSAEVTNVTVHYFLYDLTTNTGQRVPNTREAQDAYLAMYGGCLFLGIGEEYSAIIATHAAKRVDPEFIDPTKRQLRSFFPIGRSSGNDDIVNYKKPDSIAITASSDIEEPSFEIDLPKIREHIVSVTELIRESNQGINVDYEVADFLERFSHTYSEARILGERDYLDKIEHYINALVQDASSTDGSTPNGLLQRALKYANLVRVACGEAGPTNGHGYLEAWRFLDHREFDNVVSSWYMESRRCINELLKQNS